MHREISHIDEAFHPESSVGLYLFTGLIGLLIGLDLWPEVAAWLGPKLGVGLPSLLGGGVTFGGTLYRFSLIAAVLGGARILYGSLESLFAGKIGADLALAVAVIAAILINQPLVAAEVVFIGMFGECLEAFTFNRTQQAIRKLVEVCPRMCILLRDGQEVRVRVEETRVGDRVLVRPGKRVPVDGVVVEGRSALDQSALTGESLPADKEVGDDVFAGTLNQFGALTVEVRRVAEHTVVGQVIEMTARALKDKAPMERTADRLARYFLPVVLGLALLTFLVNMWWYGVYRPAPGYLYLSIYPTLAVLVVACPCALILATPAAVIAALGRLAGTGVLIKGGTAIERLAHVNAIAFDKTGTLTEGKLQLGDVIPVAEGVTANEVLRLAAIAEQRSEHLVATLIVNEARARNLHLDPVQDFLAHPGAGVAAQTAAGNLVVGTRRFLQEQGIAVPANAEAALANLDETGQTSLLVAQNGQIIGVIGARDQVRPEASSILEELAALGISEVMLLTGDRAAATRSISQQLDIADVQAELLPAQKAEWIERWRAQGRIVVMVGDGINDAPALAKANVGIALGGVGADIAAEAGDIVLMGEPLRPLPFLFRLSRQTVEIIRQNILFFAFGVNAIGIILTAWIMPAWSESARHNSPIWAAIYHQLGSLAVLLNAMRLLWFERTDRFPVLRGLRRGSERLDFWLEHASFHEFSHWLEHRWRRILGGGAAAAIMLYLLSGLTIIQSDEIGIVQRFGRPLQKPLSPGLYWRLPPPWEIVARLKPGHLRGVEVGFRTLNFARPGPAALTWASPHGDNIAREPEEALMITGDGNLIETQALVYYTVAEPHRFLFEVAQPEAVLRSLAESVLREVVAERPFITLLTSRREEFQREVMTRLQERCRREYQLGIRLQSIAFQDLHPPQEVVEAYYQVTRALSEKDRRAIAARTEKESQISREESARQRMSAEAEGGKFAVIANAEAERDAFLRFVAVHKPEMAKSLLLPMPPISSPFALTTMLYHLDLFNGGLQELTEFRLTLEAAEQVLTGRQKILHDPKLPGPLRLYQMDPEMMKIRIPMMGRERFPPRPNTEEPPPQP